MATVTINRAPKSDPSGGEQVDVSTEKLRGLLLIDPDKSDPHNQRLIVGLIVNERLSIRVKAGWCEGTRALDGRAIAALAAAIIENYAEIRDVLAEKD